MSIFGALGLGLTILILQATVPIVFRELVETTVITLDTAQSIITTFPR